MRARVLPVTLLLAFTAASARPVAAQSLADVAKKESERRKDLKEPTKTFTNKDLPNAPASSSSVPSTPDSTTTGAAPSGGDKTGAKEPAKEDDKTAKDKAKDQKYWADGIKALRDKLATDKLLADAVQTRINSLTTDFVNRDDPGQRNVIAQDRQKALDQLSTLKQAITDDSKAIDDFEEEARKAGVPAGWLR